jgi:hypothetical protein
MEKFGCQFEKALGTNSVLKIERLSMYGNEEIIFDLSSVRARKSGVCIDRITKAYYSHEGR